MALISIPAVYDGKTITLLEAAPFQDPYRIMLTFVEPVADAPEDADRTAF